MLHLYSNKSGTGKTLAAVHKVGSLYKKWKFDIYSNIDLAFPYRPLEDVEDVMNITMTADQGVIILVDELDQVFGDTWSPNSADSKIGALAGKIVRKQNVTLIGTIQLDTQANTRIRGNADRFIEPLIANWINKKTLKTMTHPLSLEQKEMIEYARDELGDKVWQPGLVVQEIKELDKHGQIVQQTYSTINAQEEFYEGKNILECYDTRQLVLKDYGNEDNDSLMKAEAQEKLLTRALLKRPELKEWNVLRMPMSGYRMSYKGTYQDFNCLDIQMSSYDGSLIWIDVVGTNDENGYTRLLTAKKKWDSIFNSISLYGHHARGYIAYQSKKDWYFTELSRDNPGLYTKTGELAKGNIYLSTVKDYSKDMKSWLAEIVAKGYTLSKECSISISSPAGKE